MVDRRETYASAGVSIEDANLTKERIKPIIRKTFGPEVVRDIGSFGGLYEPDWRGSENPVLVASTDSVGTKLKVAFLSGEHRTVGIDLVSHCANDIVVQGARPLFFQDYIAMSRHDPDTVVALIEGLSAGCITAGCALLGGETAELPEFYRPGEYDLAGTIVGVVDRSRIVDGSSVVPGDLVLGLASDGLHTNGYSLARRLLFDVAGHGLDTFIPLLQRTVGEELLRVHRCYARSLLTLLDSGIDVHAMAHITGGGLVDNIPRVLPERTSALLQFGSWDMPPIFPLLREIGHVEEREMLRTFNMGVGMVVIVPECCADEAAGVLRASGETVFVIGRIIEGEPEVRFAT